MDYEVIDITEKEDIKKPTNVKETRYRKTKDLALTTTVTKKDFFKGEACPPFINGEYTELLNPETSKQVSLRILGRGSYGIVVQATKRNTDGKKRSYAIKFVYVSREDVEHGAMPSYNEIRIGYLLTDMLTSRETVYTDLVNITKTYDWTRCKLVLYDFLRVRVTPEEFLYKYNKSSLKIDKVKSYYSIIISELGPHGSAQDLMWETEAKKENAFFKPRPLSCFLIQMLCTGDNLANEIGFTHWDLSPNNILSLVLNNETNPEGYNALSYSYTHNGTKTNIFAPIDGECNRLFKFADFGLSHIHLKDANGNTIMKISGGADITTDIMVEGFKPEYQVESNFDANGIPERNGGIANISDEVEMTHTNIAYDMHKLGVLTMARLCSLFTESHVKPYNFLCCFLLLYPLIYQHWNGYWNIKMFNAYTVIRRSITKLWKKYSGVHGKTNVKSIVDADQKTIDKINEEMILLFLPTEAANAIFMVANDRIKTFSFMIMPTQPKHWRYETGQYFTNEAVADWYNTFTTPRSSFTKIKRMTTKLDLSRLDYKFEYNTMLSNSIEYDETSEAARNQKQKETKRKTDVIYENNPPPLEVIDLTSPVPQLKTRPPFEVIVLDSPNDIPKKKTKQTNEK